MALIDRLNDERRAFVFGDTEDPIYATKGYLKKLAQEGAL